MSFLYLKNKTEPKYFEPDTTIIDKDTFDTKNQSEKKIVVNSTSSLIIGEGVTINGTIKANDDVTVKGTIEGNIDCNGVTINKSGIVKGKIKIVSIVPQLNTPVCDEQTHRFSEKNGGLDKEVDIITINLFHSSICY